MADDSQEPSSNEKFEKKIFHEHKQEDVIFFSSNVHFQDEYVHDFTTFAKNDDYTNWQE